MSRLLHVFTCSAVLFMSACERSQEAAIEAEHDLFARFVIQQVLKSERITEGEALEYFKRGIFGDDDPVNYFAVGFIYEHGLYENPQDYEMAAEWYEESADRDFFRAQFKLGTLYYKGKGVPKDYVKAYMWLNLAASSGGEVTENIAKYREIVAKEMSLEQIAEAQKATSSRSTATLDDDQLTVDLQACTVNGHQFSALLGGRRMAGTVEGGAGPAEAAVKRLGANFPGAAGLSREEFADRYGVWFASGQSYTRGSRYGYVAMDISVSDFVGRVVPGIGSSTNSDELVSLMGTPTEVNEIANVVVYEKCGNRIVFRYADDEREKLDKIEVQTL